MKGLILIACGSLALVACDTTGTTTGPVSSLPGASTVCPALQSDKFDLALKAYGAATDAVNLLIDAKVLVPGSARAVAVANANDKVLAAFAIAEHARQACNSTDYTAALSQANAALTEIRTALKGS